MKKKFKYNQNSVIRGALRRIFARSPLVQEIRNESRREIPRQRKDGSRAKKDWVQRQCQVCLQWVGSSKITIDHIQPVVSIEDGFQDWNEFVARLWCDKGNLQRLCDDCHTKKTAIERTSRLLKQYSEELAAIEKQMQQPYNYKEMSKTLTKYIAKKKITGLESIVERAKKLKELLIKYK
jgi:5-methylcytosine-specific restriction endonuclease McrA